MPDFHQWRIGYVPISSDLHSPGDRRRFVYYARQRNLHFEIADPAESYDVVILSQCADLSVWRQYSKGRVVYDLIDSYLAIPKTDFKGQIRGLAKFISRQSRHLQLNYWKAIEAMCRRADAVICATDEQKSDIVKFCSNTHIILDAHGMASRTIKKNYSANRPFRIVWEGLPQTMRSLGLIHPILDRLRQKYPLELHIVTDLEYYRYLGCFGKRKTIDDAQTIFPDAKLHEWKESSLSNTICSCDLAVIPLSSDDPFAYGKPENKLLLFWRMGMPVVASATPAYARAMSGAGLQMACLSDSEWSVILEAHLTDESLRREAGEKGLVYTKLNYSEGSLLASWDRLFCSLF